MLVAPMVSRQHKPLELSILVLCTLASFACNSDQYTAVVAPESASETPRPEPPTSLWDVVDAMRESATYPRHPSDGAGRAWLEKVEGATPQAQVGQPGSFHIVFEAGPLGVAVGGAVFLQISPFWDWSTPQIEAPEALGYTEVETSAEGVLLEALTLDRQLLGIIIGGRALAAGEQIHMRYGAGPAGVAVDTYAEKNSRFWIGVDGDGDGVHSMIVDSPGVEVLPAYPAQIVVTLPTTAKLGEKIRIVIAVLDPRGNTGVSVSGEIKLEAPGLDVPERVTLEASDLGRVEVEGVVRELGIHRLLATGMETLGGLEDLSNPLIADGGPRILWADLHGHSQFSDGTGTPEDYYTYARDVAALDIAALTDHDHWGILPLVDHPHLFEEIKRVTARFHEPGRFVTLLGFEWTSWIHGHRHVLYFDDEGEVFDSISPEYETPLQLWAALGDRDALTFAHHSAGGPIATNWDFPPDPRFEPVTEIVSIHGSSEALDSPFGIYSPLPGNFVRDVLDKGYRLGFIGSGDGHDGHPGLTHRDNPSGGLAAIISEDKTRAGVLRAMRERRVYATNGPRILLRASLAGHPMGSTLHVGEGERTGGELFVYAVGQSAFERLDLIRSGEIVDSIDLEDRLDVMLQVPLEDLAAGEYIYVRVVQRDGGAAWSSPIYIETRAEVEEE